MGIGEATKANDLILRDPSGKGSVGQGQPWLLLLSKIILAPFVSFNIAKEIEIEAPTNCWKAQVALATGWAKAGSKFLMPDMFFFTKAPYFGANIIK